MPTETQMMELAALLKKLDRSMKRMEYFEIALNAMLYIVIIANVVIGIRRHHIEPFNAFMLGMIVSQLAYHKMMSVSRARAEEGRRICHAQMEMIQAMGRHVAQGAMESHGNDWRNS